MLWNKQNSSRSVFFILFYHILVMYSNTYSGFNIIFWFQIYLARSQLASSINSITRSSFWANSWFAIDLETTLFYTKSTGLLWLSSCRNFQHNYILLNGAHKLFYSSFCIEMDTWILSVFSSHTDFIFCWCIRIIIHALI